MRCGSGGARDGGACRGSIGRGAAAACANVRSTALLERRTASLNTAVVARRLIALVKALLGAKPVVVVESKEAKNAKPGEGALDLQNEQKRDDQTKRRRFQQKCLAVVRGFVCLPEASECSALQVRNVHASLKDAGG